MENEPSGLMADDRRCMLEAIRRDQGGETDPRPSSMSHDNASMFKVQLIDVL